jgi:hypothetical protein
MQKQPQPYVNAIDRLNLGLVRPPQAFASRGFKLVLQEVIKGHRRAETNFGLDSLVDSDWSMIREPRRKSDRKGLSVGYVQNINVGA